MYNQIIRVVITFRNSSGKKYSSGSSKLPSFVWWLKIHWTEVPSSRLSTKKWFSQSWNCDWPKTRITQAYSKLPLRRYYIKGCNTEITHRHPDAGIWICMSAKWSVVMVQSHQFRHLDIHVVQSTVQNSRLELVRQSEIVKTPQCGSQVKQSRLGSAQRSAE
jgi:hypothetical protein